MQTDFQRWEAQQYPRAVTAEWHSATWLNRQADLQLSLGRHVAAERLAERADALREVAQ